MRYEVYYTILAGWRKKEFQFFFKEWHKIPFSNWFNLEVERKSRLEKHVGGKYSEYSRPAEQVCESKWGGQIVTILLASYVPHGIRRNAINQKYDKYLVRSLAWPRNPHSIVDVETSKWWSVPPLYYYFLCDVFIAFFEYPTTHPQIWGSGGHCSFSPSRVLNRAVVSILWSLLSNATHQRRKDRKVQTILKRSYCQAFYTFKGDFLGLDWMKIMEY